MSLGSTKLKIVHDTEKQGQLPIIISQWQLDLKNYFNFIKFYKSALKVLYLLICTVKGKFIDVDIIFAALIFFLQMPYIR